MFFRLVLVNSLFSLRDINLILGLLPPKDTWYGVILWVLRVLGQGLKSECPDIFHQSFLWLLHHTDEPPKGRNSCLWLQSRSVLSSFGVVLMSCRVDQVFIDPTFSGIFVCGPLQSFVVNVCTIPYTSPLGQV